MNAEIVCACTTYIVDKSIRVVQLKWSIMIVKSTKHLLVRLKFIVTWSDTYIYSFSYDIRWNKPYGYLKYYNCEMWQNGYFVDIKPKMFAQLRNIWVL